MIEQLRDGIVKVEREEYTFDEEISVYILSGSTDTARVLFIDAIEGINVSGSWVPPEGAYNGVSAWKQASWNVGESIPSSDEGDYILYWTGASVSMPSDSAYPNYPLYQSIRWINPDNQPKHNSKFYVTYRYYDANLVSEISNFRAGGVINSIVEAVSISLANIERNNYYLFINNFLKYANGEALDLLAYPWGITRRSATKTSGWITITTSSGTNIVISSSHRFSTVGKNISFKAKSDYIGTVISGSSIGHIEIEATDYGSSFNTGPNTIVKFWEDEDMTTEVTGVSVSNYPYYNGEENYFTNGQDEETDEEMRTRVYNAAIKQGSATYSAIESAVEDIAGVIEAKVYDIENKPFISENYFQVFVVGDEKIIKNSSLLSQIYDTINEKKPVGTTFSVLQPIPKFTYIDMVITPDEGYWYNKNELISRVNSAISNYLSSLKLGEDVVYSEIIERAMDVTGVYSAKINNLYTSTYVFSTETSSYPLEYVYDISSASGTAFAQEFYMGTKSWRQHETHSSGTTTYTISGSYISSNYSNPLVYLSIEDENGKWIRNPLYNANYYSSHTSTQITITETPPSGSVGRYLQDGDDLVFVYESFDYNQIIGAIVSLSGTAGDIIELSIWSGSGGLPSTKLASGTVTLSSGVGLYFAEFDNTLILSNSATKHWLVASGISTSDSCYIGTNTNDEVPDKGESYKYYNGTTWVTPSAPMKMIVMIPISGTNDIIVDNEIWKSEVAVEYQTNITAERKN